VEPGREAEAQTRDERVREVDVREIDVRIGAEERAHFVLRRQELRERIGQCRRHPRANLLRRPQFPSRLGRWLERGNEPPADHSRIGRTPAATARGEGAGG
jgi:hypothetical protein